jgi:hypothetical protein
MAFTQDFVTQRRNYDDGNTRIGDTDRLWYDSITQTIRISDGVTPGGIVITGGGSGGDGATTFKQLFDTPSSFTGAAGNFVKVNSQEGALEFVDIDLFDGDYNSLSNRPTPFDPSSIDQSLIPDTDVTYDLGSTDKKWRDLYLSGNTIYLGTATIQEVDGVVNLPENSKINGKRIPTDFSELSDSSNTLTTFKDNINGNAKKIKSLDSIEFYDIGSVRTSTITTSSATTTNLVLFNATQYRSLKLLIQATNTTDNTYYVSELLCYHDGTEAYSTEYAKMTTSTTTDFLIFPILNNGNFVVRITTNVADTIEFKILAQTISV